ncbi:MAG: pentapeptide repeat-containing protein [Candidatus Korobacteraceae bacterium]
MANPEHLAKLKEGVGPWNQWREQNPEIWPDLSEADLDKADLSEADLNKANLREANLREAELIRASLREANLGSANLSNAKLFEADLRGAHLSKACLRGAYLRGAQLRAADLSGADLSGADLSEANLSKARFSEAKIYRANLSGANLGFANLAMADLSGANLSRANLSAANLANADLRGANLSRADLFGATLLQTNLEQANLTACSVYGISAWNVRLEGATQKNLVITPWNESPIQVDNLEVAQFIYLLLNNQKIRSVIDTITSKVVLILGRFTPERKVVLDAIRDELRKRDYLPVLFDFEKPASKDLTGTISTLANLARFVIADLTDPSSVPHELATLAPHTVVPVQAIILEGQREYAMFPDLMRRHHWVLEPYQYKSQKLLIAHLGETVIAPAEAKAKELAKK